MTRSRAKANTASELAIVCEGQDVSKGTTTLTDVWLAARLPSQAVFEAACVFGPYIKSFVATGERDRMALFEQALNIEVFRACEEHSKAWAQDIQTSIGRLSERIASTHRTIESLRARKAETEDDTGREQEIKQAIEAEQAAFEKATGSTWDQGLADWNEVQALHRQLTGEISLSALALERKRSEERRLQGKKREYEQASKARTCPECGQDVAASHVEEHLATTSEALTAIGVEITTASEALKVSRESLDDLSGYRDAIVDVRSHLDRLERDLVAECERRSSVADNLDQLIDEHEKSLPADQGALVENESQLEEARFWVEGFGPKGVRSLVMDQVVPLINEELQAVRNSFLGEKYDVCFDTEKTTGKGTKNELNFTVTRTDGSPTWEACSDGEKRKVTVAIALATQRAVAALGGLRTNIRWYDEVFDNIDETGREAAVDLLLAEAKNLSSLYAVTHNRDMASKFQREWVVTKKAGVATVDCGA